MIPTLYGRLIARWRHGFLLSFNPWTRHPRVAAQRPTGCCSASLYYTHLLRSVWRILSKETGIINCPSSNIALSKYVQCVFPPITKTRTFSSCDWLSCFSNRQSLMFSTPSVMRMANSAEGSIKGDIPSAR